MTPEMRKEIIAAICCKIIEMCLRGREESEEKDCRKFERAKLLPLKTSTRTPPLRKSLEPKRSRKNEAEVDLRDLRTRRKLKAKHRLQSSVSRRFSELWSTVRVGRKSTRNLQS